MIGDGWLGAWLTIVISVMGYLMGDGHSAVGCYPQNIEVIVVARYVTPRFEVGVALVEKPRVDGHGTPSD